jgi:Tfp pilus assembly protein PilF
MTKPRKKLENPLRSAQHEAALEEYEKGMRLLQQKDYQKAIPRFEAILRDHAEESSLCDRARAYLRIARGDVAARMPLRATRNPAECYEVGLYLLNDGDTKEALRHLQRAAEHAPEDGGVMLTLAAAHLHCGDVEACLQALERAIALSPRHAAVANNLSDFEPLHGDERFDTLVGA